MVKECINKVELSGFVGTARISPAGGRRVICFSLATKYFFKDRRGTVGSETTWHNVVAWEGSGMPDLDLIRKGAMVHLTGRLRTNRYTDAVGIEKTVVEVLASEINLIED